MNWQPIIDAGAELLLWPPVRYLLALFIVWHLIIGRQTAIRWVEALGWNGVMGFLTRIGWLSSPPAPPASPVEAELSPPLPFARGSIPRPGVGQDAVANADRKPAAS